MNYRLTEKRADIGVYEYPKLTEKNKRENQLHPIKEED